MSQATLYEIQKLVSALCTRGRTREQLLKWTEGKTSKMPVELEAVPSDLLQQIDWRGVELYSGLLRQGQLEAVTSIYPGCSMLIGDRWEATVESYLEHYPPSHYHLNQIGSKFPGYLAEHGQSHQQRFPFLIELADYEWLELELMESDIKICSSDWMPPGTVDDFERLSPVINPVLTIRDYIYPIPALVDHLLLNGRLPEPVHQNPTSVAVYRHPETHQCKFLELGHTTRLMIEHHKTQPGSYKQLFSQILSVSPGSDPQELMEEFLELIELLHSLKLFVGSAPI